MKQIEGKAQTGDVMNWSVSQPKPKFGTGHGRYVENNEGSEEISPGKN